jgi:hypothetical protein
MLAYRWWRNRQAGPAPANGSWAQPSARPANGSEVGTGSGQVF